MAFIGKDSALKVSPLEQAQALPLPQLELEWLEDEDLSDHDQTDLESRLNSNLVIKIPLMNPIKIKEKEILY